MNETRYTVKGKELADLVTDRHLEDLYYGKSGNLVALTLKDPDTIELHGGRDDLDDIVKTLARDYEKGVVTRYEMSDGKFGAAVSINETGLETTKDWTGKDMPGVETYRLSGKNLGDDMRAAVRRDFEKDLMKGSDFAFGISAPVRLASITYETPNTVIMKAYSEDAKNMAKSIGSYLNEDVVSLDHVQVDGKVAEPRISFDSRGNEIHEDWLGRPCGQPGRRVLPLNGELDGVLSNGLDAEYEE